MNKPSKIIALFVAVGLFGIGLYVGQQQGDNRDQVVGSSDRYSQTDSAETASRIVMPAVPDPNGEVHIVKDGESIQEAVAKAKPGDTIKVMPGTYVETVYIDKDNITLSGVVEGGKRPVLEGEGHLNDAILYSGNGIIVENLLITHYKGNAIMGQAGNNFVIRNNIVVDTGVYGIFPQLGKNGLIVHNVLSGIEDAAIYVGMSDNIHVAHNEVFDNVAGIEIENTRHAIVENNYVHDNTGGILAFITPGLPIKTCYDVIIRNNFVVNNNHENFGAPGSIVAGVPQGSGIVIMAADEVTIEGNQISGNQNAGIIITDHANLGNLTMDPESEPNPDQVAILDNLMFDNGTQPIPEIKALMVTKLVTGNPDIVRVGPSKDSCILNRDRYITAGINDFATCGFETTMETVSYLSPEPVAPRTFEVAERGKAVYYGVCTGCHAYNVRMIGPPTQIIQAMYMDNPEGLAEFIAAPVKKRPDYPEMPSQAYLDEETRLAVAKFMLTTDK
jgi:parallel beta-helix repeat protein